MNQLFGPSVPMLTEEQMNAAELKDAQRLARYVNREQLVSVMNDTKWQRLFDALEPLQGWLDFRRKDVRGSEGEAESWCSDMYMMLGRSNNIEWLDIRALLAVSKGGLHAPTIEDNTAHLIQSVRQAGVRFSKRGDYIRIWGYTRLGASPDWEG